LLMSIRVLLSPEDSQKLRPVILYVERARNLCVARQTESQHL
jgi:hypothetical protein